MYTERFSELLNLYTHQHDTDIVKIRCRLEFEPHGHATEDWEEVWYLELPQHQYYWENNVGELIKGSEGLTQNFKGKTLNDVIEKSIKWLEKYNKLK